MKSTKEDKAGYPKLDFPKLMVANDGLVVLFKYTEDGVVVNQGKSSSTVGEYADDWVMSEFTDYHGKIILEN